MSNKIEELELDTFQDEGDISELPPPDIIAYNELRSCADLYRMYEKKYSISVLAIRGRLFGMLMTRHDLLIH